jgi:hypothetical protein
MIVEGDFVDAVAGVGAPQTAGLVLVEVVGGGKRQNVT